MAKPGRPYTPAKVDTLYLAFNQTLLVRWISIEDIRDIYLKIVQRGWGFVASKASFSSAQRTRSAFNTNDIDTANWWIVPEIRRRWNRLITGSPDMSYEEFMSSHSFADYGPVKMVSVGYGSATYEIRLAELNPHWEILCFDFSDNLINEARQVAQSRGLKYIFRKLI